MPRCVTSFVNTFMGCPNSYVSATVDDVNVFCRALHMLAFPFDHHEALV